MRALAVGTLMAACTACATAPRLETPPAASLAAAPAGFPAAIRTYSLDREFIETHASEIAGRVAASATDGSLDLLALSGGGAGGAFGAGVLVGLTEAGTRPQFEVVTGVSTGALIAPFAFLGSDWDDELAEAYTGGASEHLMVSRGVGVLFGAGLFQGRPLRELVDRFVTDDLLAAVAREAALGRGLFVATTNLDREETAIWNLGAIAQQGGPRARELFRDVLIASASMPGVFPPIIFEVEHGGEIFHEMHVDGGVTTPLFVAPDIIVLRGSGPEALRGANAYVISNAQLTRPARTTPADTASIASRSLSAVLDHLTRDALLQAEDFATRNGMHFRFTTIPHAYPDGGSLAFNQNNMSALFEYGRSCAAQGLIWLDAAEQVLALDRRAERVTAPERAPCPSVLSAGASSY